MGIDRDFDSISEETNSEDNELEKEFLAAHDAAWKEIKPYLEAAETALDKAEEIAAKYGVPFNSNICPLSNTYFPRSYKDKYFKKLDEDFLSGFDIYHEDSYCVTGWMYSAAGC